MAVTIDAQVLADEVGVDLPTGTRYLGLATAMHARYLGAAVIEDELSNEGCIQIAGTLKDKPPGGVRSIEAGPLNASFAPSMVSVLRSSGAMALWSPYKRRRAR